MHEISTIGIDIAKQVFQLHGADGAGESILSRRLRRGQVAAFFAALPPSIVGIEACGTAHFWAREIARCGHDLRLMPPGYVKPYVKRNKHDAADAKAVCEAVRRQDHAASGGRLRPVLTAVSAAPPRSQVGTKNGSPIEQRKRRKETYSHVTRLNRRTKCLRGQDELMDLQDVGRPDGRDRPAVSYGTSIPTN